jgi:hypothetical protein
MFTFGYCFDRVTRLIVLAEAANVLTPESNRRKQQAGQAVIMITLGITFLLGLLGLVVDVGYAYYVKQAAQGAADAAVMAAITSANSTRGICGTGVLCQTGYSCPSSPTNSTDFGVACLYAGTNGFVNSGGQTVSISSGTGVPPTAPGITTKHWITATISQKLSLGFLAALGVNTGYAYSQSTSAVVVAPSPGCIYVMKPTNTSMTVAGSSSTLINTTCGIFINSSAANALSVSGQASVTASLVDIVGGAQTGGGASVSPMPATGSAAVADPLGNLPAPAFSGCDHTAYTLSGGTTTLSQGVYCGGITLSGSANVTFNPGTYILNGGGLNVSSTNVVLNGNGVTFYNTATVGNPFAPIAFSGGSNITLTAPASGTYQGILFFQDRSISTSGGQNSITGQVGATLSGTIYMPSGNLTFAGGSSSGALTVAIVAYTFQINGGAYLQGDTSGARTALNTAAYLVQ